MLQSCMKYLSKVVTCFWVKQYVFFLLCEILVILHVMVLLQNLHAHAFALYAFVCFFFILYVKNWTKLILRYLEPNVCPPLFWNVYFLISLSIPALTAFCNLLLTTIILIPVYSLRGLSTMCIMGNWHVISTSLRLA